MTTSEQLLQHAEWLLDERWLSQSLAAFNAAERMGADADRCSAGRWMVFMLQGDFQHAWRESDSIRRRGAPDPHRFWNGELIDDRNIIVRCLHGFGDAIQFLRFAPLLKERAERVIVEVAPRLVELARTLPGIDQVITWGDAAPARPPHSDVQIEVTELPYFFRIDLRELPFTTSYLRLPVHILRQADHAFPASNRARIGIAWSCGPWNLSRSIPLRELAPILPTPGCEFWNLQGGAVRDEWRLLRHLPNVHDEHRLCADAGLLPLAGFISQLDLVITVDTLAAHLGGALGVPTWVLLRHEADWRWMLDREDSPWYPSIRLFRQNRDAQWNDVVHLLQTALSEWMSERHIGKAVA